MNYSKLLSLINGVPRTVDFSSASNTLLLNGGLDLSGNLEINGATSGYVILNASATTSTYTLTLPPAQAASSGYVLTNDGTGVLSWTNPSSGSVTSVGLTLPSSVFNVTVSPITSSGNLTAVFQTQAANSIFAGPGSGSAAAPTFRAMVAADLPSTITSNTSGTAANITATSNSTLTTLSSLSLPATQLTGTLQASQFPALTGDVTTSAGSLATSLVATSNATLATLSALTTASSLSSVGTITSGTWNGTTVAIAHGGTGQTTAAAAFNALAPASSTGGLIYASASNTYSNLAVGTTGQVLTVSGGLPVWATPSITPSSIALTQNHILVGNASNLAADVAMSGEASIVASGAITLSNAAVIAKVLTGFSAAPGTVTSADSILSAIEKLAGNDGLYLPLAGGTMSGNIAMGSNNITGLSDGTYTGSALNTGMLGQNNGVASLDSSGKVPYSQLPSALMTYKGAWNPTDAVNTLTALDPTPLNGDVYRASADGIAVAGNGAVTGEQFYAGDFAIYNGTAWQRSPLADGVVSVNGATGAVTVNAINQLTGDVTTSAASGSQSEATTVAKIQGTTVSGTTGTGNVVFSASPTFTGTITAAAANFSGSISASNFSGSSSGTNTGDVTIGTANGLSLSGQALSLQLASSSQNGALSSTDWTTFNNKQNALSFGNLTDAGTDGITVTGGTGAVIGSGTSIAQQKADATHNGYLSSTDWSTFNSKLTSTLASADIFVGNASNVATAVAMSGDVTIDNTGATTIGAAKVTLSKMASNSVDENKIVSTSFSTTGAVTGGSGTKIAVQVDGSTIDINGSNQLEVKAAGVSATQLATGAFDQVTILGGAGTPAYIASAPANIQMFTAGQTFAANTSYAVRMMIPSDAGYVAGRVIAADQDTSVHDLFWVIGIAFSAAGVSAGSPIAVQSLGSYTLGSGDAAFSSGDVGKPAWLTAAGDFSATVPSTSGYANFKVGMIESTSSIFINGQMMGVA